MEEFICSQAHSHQLGIRQLEFKEKIGESVICEFQCGQRAQPQPIDNWVISKRAKSTYL